MRIIPIFFLLILFSCGGEKDDYLKPLNLLEYNVALTILAPDSVEVSKQKFGVSDEVTIESRNSDDYQVRIYFGDATLSTEEIKAQQLQFLKDSKIVPFSKLILDEPAGFVYETKIDSTLLNYGFRRIVIMGDREYIFHSGSGTYTQAQAEEMYQATLPQEVEVK